VRKKSQRYLRVASVKHRRKIWKISLEFLAQNFTSHATPSISLSYNPKIEVRKLLIVLRNLCAQELKQCALFSICDNNLCKLPFYRQFAGNQFFSRTQIFLHFKAKREKSPNKYYNINSKISIIIRSLLVHSLIALKKMNLRLIFKICRVNNSFSYRFVLLCSAWY
jgi:hypothetical protein